MGFFNLGKKDAYGKQTRIEHRGKHLRVSRTGGASLRAQTKAAGLNLTVNTRHGFRVSRRIGKNTQMAMQNGRFVLRGRYGKGPTKLNLSKSGVTFSTRNQLGTFNWLKPNRSSAKLFGVQVRGKNAATAQMVFILFAGAAQLLGVAYQLLLLLLSGIWSLLKMLWGLLSMTPYGVQQVVRAWRNRAIKRAQKRLPNSIKASLAEWSGEQLTVATTLAFLAWGRGKPTQTVLPFIPQNMQTTPHETIDAAATCKELDAWQTLAPDSREPVFLLAIIALLGEYVAQKTDPSDLPEMLFQIDDLALQQGPKTRFQEQMLEVFSDAAGLRVELSAYPID